MVRYGAAAVQYIAPYQARQTAVSYRANIRRQACRACEQYAGAAEASQDARRIGEGYCAKGVLKGSLAAHDLAT